MEKTLGAEGSDKPTKEKQAKATASDSSKATDASSPSKRPASEKVGTETLSTWMFRQEQQGHMDADLAVIINSISVACKRISNLVATAPIAGLTGLADSTNESGDEQKKLDIISNDIFCDAMKDTSRCAVIVTEEEDVPLGVADCVSGDCTYCAFPKSQHCFTEAGDCCPYIATYKTDTFFLFISVGAISVLPIEGHALCFPHGESSDSPVHEGSGVFPGPDGNKFKYIVRTDVLFEVETQ